MNNENNETVDDLPSRRSGGFRRAVLRGLGVILPLLLTIAVLGYVWKTVDTYVFAPVESGIRHAWVWRIEDTKTVIPSEATALGTNRLNGFTYDGQRYVPDPTGRRWFPEYVKKLVDDRADYFGPYAPPPASATAYWHRYVELEYLPRKYVVPIFLLVFTTVLYFLGRLFTFGLGRWFVHVFDQSILRIPLVNKVYGSVKQVTDFAFSEREIEFNRVVAIQYPSKGVWSLGFVTGNSLVEIADATGEPMLSVLMPTSPMPMTGFTVTVARSEAIDLNLTIDEAIQFIVSCGVVVPPNQRVDQIAAGKKRSNNPIIHAKLDSSTESNQHQR
ncbi:DUF502 domain-containing protein [Rubripirellula amarantea]|uniref:DUF502 domain-containing protein n=1 Tax=Rubripirellula amarantea TaxID=2527999 RepID=A0A5C5WRB6_9BACT|nr:DUF502 domain-containing protein [Rubripirellula amarantea]MDA8744715.1 DUF502 domain-containing protein [Rubripirellula amarantea]TWT52719.1 hypothetical protein Pla22_03450 [Rubripirellula amarantea]